MEILRHLPSCLAPRKILDEEVSAVLTGEPTPVTLPLFLDELGFNRPVPTAPDGRRGDFTGNCTGFDRDQFSTNGRLLPSFVNIGLGVSLPTFASLLLIYILYLYCELPLYCFQKKQKNSKKKMYIYIYIYINIYIYIYIEISL